MPGRSMPSEPLPAGNELPAAESEAASRYEPSQSIAGPLRAASESDGKAIGPGLAMDAIPAGAGGSMTPAGMGAGASPGPLGSVPDPAAVTGPPWPRLVAAAGAYAPPRLIRWPIVMGIVLLAGWIAAAAVVRAAPTSTPSPAAASSPSSAAAYVLAASDARFTATFPSKPQRTVQAAGIASVIAYIAVLSDHAVAVTYVRLPAPGSFSLNGAINGAATSLPGGKVISRRSLTYHGQPAEDAVISVSGGSGRVRVVRFGSSGYIFVGFGNTAVSFAHDYKVLLDSFTPHQ